MRFRTGVVVGVAIGYYLGSKAGVDAAGDLSEQPGSVLRRSRASAGRPADEKLRALIDLGMERAHDVLDQLIGAASPGGAGGAGGAEDESG